MSRSGRRQVRNSLPIIKSMWCNGSTRALGAWGGVQIAHILLTKKGKEN